MEQADLIIRLITELREDMNVRFERLESRVDRKLDAKLDAKLALEMHATVLAEFSKLNERLTEETLWGRREIRNRLERCERDIEELKGRKGS